MKSVGVIGFGNFGGLLVDVLGDKFELKVYSRTISKVPVQYRATLEQASKCDYLILSIPLSNYREVLSQVSKYIETDTVVVDICSVKTIPSKIVRELLPNNELVSTHPLFGPQTVKNGLEDLVVVFCDDYSDKVQAEKLKTFCRGLGLDVREMTAEEHDKQMAKVHALTFFVARGLMDFDVDSVSLKTPSFGNIESLINLERKHTYDLFETIQLGNPYSAKVRTQVIEEFKKLDDKLSSTDKVY